MYRMRLVCLQPCLRLVGGPVVDDDYLVTFPRRGQDAVHGAPDERRAIVSGNDHGHAGRCHREIAWRAIR
jgi:hypothetical protein